MASPCGAVRLRPADSPPSADSPPPAASRTPARRRAASAHSSPSPVVSALKAYSSTRGELLQQEKASRTVERELEDFRAQCATPVTRLDYSIWFDDNEYDLRRRMVTAPGRRRELNVRAGPREGLPPPVKRFQPSVQIAKPKPLGQRG